MNIVITGATGAIGMALIDKWIQEKNHVWVICHRGSTRAGQIPDSPYISIAQADLSEYGTLNKQTIGMAASESGDIFYHLAWAGTTGDARNNMSLQISNIQYTIEAVELAARLGCHTFIGTGSQAEYGRVEGLLAPDTFTCPENGYGIAKLCAGQMSRIRCRQVGMRHIWTRILSVYGPYDTPYSMISSAINRLLGGERAAFTEGKQQWDYLYSADAAEALYLLGHRGVSGQTYVLGSGIVRELRYYIEILAQEITAQTGKTCQLGLGDVPYAQGQVMYLGADISKLQEDTGFAPRTDFADGIRQTIEFYRKKG